MFNSRTGATLTALLCFSFGVEPLWAAPPLGIPDAYSTYEDTALSVAAPGLKANDYHPDGLDFLVSNFLPPSNGTLTSIVTSGAFVYEPDPGYTGPDSFSYTLLDTDEVYSEPVTVTIEVLPDPNRAPIGVDDFYGTPQDTTLTVAAPGLMSNDVEPDGDDFMVSNFSPPTHGTLTSIVTNGAFVYEPDTGFTGIDTFSYTLRDSDGLFSEPVHAYIFVGVEAPAVLQPQLTVTKIVVNDHGGTLQVAHFPLFVDATPVTSGAQNGFDAGTYVVSEIGNDGYAATFGGDCAPNGTITLETGVAKACTITNDDIQPSLTLVKVVNNGPAGPYPVEAWTLSADGPTPLSGAGFASSGVDAGTYVLSEHGPVEDYRASDWACSGGSQNGDEIDLAPGEEATCTITNTYVTPVPVPVGGKWWLSLLALLLVVMGWQLGPFRRPC